jgi:hypothetical protein
MNFTTTEGLHAEKLGQTSPTLCGAGISARDFSPGKLIVISWRAQWAAWVAGRA